MKITDIAKQTLQDIFEQREAKGIRIYSVGAGCCGPQIGLSLDLPKEKDIMMDVNGVRVAVEQDVENIISDLTLDKDGDRFVLLGLDSCC